MAYRKTHQPRIDLVAGIILTVVTVVVGVTVFIVMERYAEKLLTKSLQSALQDRIQLTQIEIATGFERTEAVATRPLLIDQVHDMNAGKDADVVMRNIDRVAQSFLVRGFSAVAVFDQNGRELASVGSFTQRSALTVPINLPGHVQLSWDGQLLLHVGMDMKQEGRIVGKVITEMPLPTTTGLLKNVNRLGKTAEVALCVPFASKMRCFPSYIHPQVQTISQRTPKGDRLPMAYALAGEAGFIAAHDYRGREVVAAYAPVGGLALGMVLKMDSAELFSEVWNQLRYLTPLLGGMLVIALLLLRWQLTPLVARLVRSEADAHAISASLADSERRVRALLNNVDEGIVSISAAGMIELFNPAAERMFGYRSEQVLGKSVFMLMPAPDHSEHDGYLEGYLHTGKAHMAGIEREMAARRSDGTVFPMDVRISEFYLEGRRQFIGIMRDITERKANEAKIIRLAHYDTLTDLPNRWQVQERIQQTIVSAQRTRSRFAVLFLDLDKFKTINDTLGHAIGDQLLKMVAARLTNALREKDTVGRQGGDEFIVLLESLGAAEDAAPVAQKILDVFAAPFVIDKQRLRTGTSIGIAVYPHDGTDVETLLKHSDTAMYYAKERGRSNYQFFTPAMNIAATERLLLESSLHQAIHRGELVLHYQPLVSLADGSVVATEALVRWNHPELGLIAPVRFISVAEESGLIVALGDWVLRQACGQLKQWREQGMQLPRMVVNLSPRQFRQKNLVQNFSRILQETGVDPHWLGLEITEGVIMDNPEVSIGILTELRMMGIELSLDDFGTGFSSLSHLKRFPIDKLKIDRSFVQDITSDPNDKAMVAAIIVMAHQLNIRVVAEGVETEAQLAFLRKHGCDEYQGYLYSKPLVADDLSTRLDARPSELGLLTE